MVFSRLTTWVCLERNPYIQRSISLQQKKVLGWALKAKKDKKLQVPVGVGLKNPDAQNESLKGSSHYMHSRYCLSGIGTIQLTQSEAGHVAYTTPELGHLRLKHCRFAL